MSIEHACEWLQSLDFPTDIRESAWLFPTIETVHVLALVLVVGSILMVDLRLLGIANRARPVTELTRQTLPLTWCAFVVAAAAGSLLFSSKALTYYANVPFRMKMLCLAGAGLNMLWFHAITYRRVEEWNRGDPPWGARIAGGLSLILWVMVVATGRWIGFTT